jgi:Flp pilus assembly pilin Flp
MFKFIKKLVKKFKTKEKGQSMVEYALIITFVVAVALVSLNSGIGKVVLNALDGAGELTDSAYDEATKKIAESEGGSSGETNTDETNTDETNPNGN